MNITDLKDEDILKAANAYWDDLVKYSNNKTTVLLPEILRML